MGRLLGTLLAGLILALAGQAGAAANPDAIAVIIGNRDYQNDVPAVTYAHRDAEAMKRYVIEDLGFRPGNVIELKDATEAEMRSVFGSERNHRGRAFQFVRPGRSDLFVFYSGHGVPGLRDKRGYLLPSDANPDTADINGYPIDLLYENLRQTGARSITVLLDACFSGDSPRGMLIKSASPIFIAPKLPTDVEGITIITAAAAGQLASWDEEAKQGLFTEHVLLALRGTADQGRYGDGDGKVTLKEVEAYLTDEMTYQARRKYNRDQVPTVVGKPERVLAAYTPGALERVREVAPKPAPAAVAPAVPAPAPAPAPAAQPAPPKPAAPQLAATSGRFVLRTNSNVRAAPRISGDLVTTLPEGSELDAVAQTVDGKWMQVARGGEPIGFVYAELLEDHASYEARRRAEAQRVAALAATKPAPQAPAVAPAQPTPQVAMVAPPKPATPDTPGTPNVTTYDGAWIGTVQSCGWGVFVGADDAAPRDIEVKLNVQRGDITGSIQESVSSGAYFFAKRAIAGKVGDDGAVDVLAKDLDARLRVTLTDADRADGMVNDCEIEMRRQ
ncbi:MAG: caspase family protein [Alphaproteobacteria bacterium]